MATTAESAAKKAPEQAILNLGLTDEEKMVGESLMTLALRRLRRDYLTLFAVTAFISLRLYQNRGTLFSSHATGTESLPISRHILK